MNRLSMYERAKVSDHAKVNRGILSSYFLFPYSIENVGQCPTGGVLWA